MLHYWDSLHRGTQGRGAKEGEPHRNRLLFKDVINVYLDVFGRAPGAVLDCVGGLDIVDYVALCVTPTPHVMRGPSSVRHPSHASTYQTASICKAVYRCFPILAGFSSRNC